MLVVPFSLPFARNSSRLRFLIPASAARVARLAMSASPQAAATVSVEYAKSGRSTCKGCSGAIASGALRLGVSARDPRGFDATKWYHVACFPSASHPLGSVESINGFDSIKEADREELHELEKNPKREQTAASPLEEPSPKKVKTQSPAEGVSDKASVSVEYAKSGRSTCKGCNENIAKATLRLGASFHDTRGFENTKWYHVTCFPTSSYPVFPVENLKGFDSVEDHDREKLQKLAENHKSDDNAADQLKKEMAHSIGDSKEVTEKNPEEVKNPLGKPSPKKVETHMASLAKGVSEKELEENYKRDGNAADQSSEPNLKEQMVDSMGVSKEGAENNLEAVKLAAGNNRIRPAISFSVSDISKDYKGATLPTHWKAFETVIFREQEDGLHASAKIAAFDFDGCLAKTSVRIIGADKWSLQHKSIPEKLQRLYIDGYKLVIFTNESNIDRWKNKRQEAIDSKVGRLDNFIECVKVPIQVFIACGLGKGKGTPDDPYRKPNPGMWCLMAQHFNSGIEIDMDKSFYVGDAAGRENDHSDADIEFAKAIGLKFHVPEEYFGP
ncbi:polynucleotide 3'-phosphatase ZDP isoform X2 [Setaria italica]|uniref:polynucleotide 3'-phosphatase ZDP isoform X2 n=1 Tax=Setaria italica TaxID=4555 RepID=UPI0003513E4D|nr:polynucleotide 3'-phosphatase ZDP isoform X2 [Setaria italica]